MRTQNKSVRTQNKSQVGFGKLSKCPRELFESILLKQIYPLPSTQPIWNFTLFQSKRNKKNNTFRLLVSYVEGVLYLSLDIAAFRD